MHWSYWDLMDLPADVYVVLLEQLIKEADADRADAA
jgi:hypothetical protein